MKSDFFAPFTNLYPLSKTLRFELKPIWKTKELLNESNWFFPDFEDKIFPKDKRINEIYQNIIKPCLNNLHSQLIEESLEWVTLELSEDTYKLRKSSIDRKLSENDKKVFNEDFDKKKKELRKQIVNYLTNSRIQEKYSDISGCEDLMKKEIIPVLAKIYSDQIYKVDQNDKTKKYENPDLIWQTYWDLIQNYFIGFFTYLSNFNTNRWNLYKDDGKASRVATRCIEENMIRFFQNKKSYEIFSWFIEITSEVQSYFDILCFQNYLNQKGIQKYNSIIGEINSKINSYNQNHSWWIKLPKLLELHKQILAKPDKENIFSFVSSIIEDDEDLEGQLNNFFVDAESRIAKSVKNILEALFKKNFDYEKIYFKKSILKDISNKYLNNWDTLSSLLPQDENEKKQKKWSKTKWKEKREVVSLQEIKSELDSVSLEWFLKESWVKVLKEDFKVSLSSDTPFFQLLKSIRYDACIQQKRFETYTKILDKKLFSGEFSTNLRNKEKDIEVSNVFMTTKTVVKEAIEAVLSFEQILRYFSLESWQWKTKEIIDVEFDSDFYGEIDEFYANDFRPYKFFNAVRNYVTKKQYSTDKIKLNFDNSTFLDWWDKNKEAANFWVILRKDGKYFLAVMKKWESNIFSESNSELYSSFWKSYEKLNYKQIALPTWVWWFVRKCFKSAQNYWWRCPTGCLNGEWNIIIKDNEVWDNLISLIDCYKDFFNLYEKDGFKYKEFQFKFAESNSYAKLSDFFKDVENQSYKLWFTFINADILDSYVEQWKLFIFQIYNKDFSDYHKWKENLHTKYRRALFSDENLLRNNILFKLSWGAEIFFRPATVSEKRLKDLKRRNDWAIECKRFTEDKILFHCPITLNFVNKNDFKINDKVKEYARNHRMNVLGIDRWEKHLLYYALIDQDGNILKKGDEMQLCTMNTIPSEQPDWTIKEVKYYDKLVKKEGDRAKERTDWNEIENIKEMKTWYLSHVVHKLVDLAISHNAIIVLEDLNSGFKNSRIKVERQIYQKFELALAKKLNFVVDKNKSDDELWWLYQAYQLTPKVENFQDIYTQTWILFYTQAWYTSTTCPVCWFRKNIYKKYDSVRSVKERIKNIDLKIKKEWSDFSFFYTLESLEDRKWNKRAKLDRKLTTKDQIRLYNERIEKWTAYVSTSKNLSEEFGKLFRENNIDQSKIVESMLEIESTQFFKDFIFYWNLLLQIRNSKEWDDGGYLQCPSCWFHSENWFQWTKYNWDANGAYNIARKWVIILKKINDNEKTLWITNVEWDNFSQTYIK